MDVIKHCLYCGKEFTISDTDSRRLYCSERCGNRYRQQRHYQNNKEYYRSKRRLYKVNNYEFSIFCKLRSRAKKNGIAFNLTPDDIIIPEYCPVLGIKIERNHGHSGYFDNSPSVDRIKPELGYTKGNIRVISNRANLLKNNATVEELELILQDLRRLYS